MTQSNKNSTLQNVALRSTLVVVVFFVSSVLFHQYQYAFHSDAAIKTVLGRLAYSDGSLVPGNWVYANGDILLLSPYIFSIFLYPFLGVSYAANATATWLAYVCLVLAVYYACRRISGNSRAALVSAIFSAAGISAANFEFVVAQGAYSMYAAVAVCVYAIIAPSKGSNDNFDKFKNSLGVSLFGFFISAWACISNPTRGIITITLPVVLGWFAFIIFSGNAGGRRKLLIRQYVSIVPIVVGSALGAALFKYVIFPKILNFDAAAKVGLASFSEILIHLRNIPAYWLEYFQIWGGWKSLSAGLRALQLATWLIASTFVFLPIYTIITSKQRSQSLTCLAWMLLTSYAITFSAMIISPTLLSSPLDMRYVAFPTYGAVCMLGIYVDEFASRHEAYGKFILAFLVVVGIASAQQWRNEYGKDFVSSGDSSYTRRMSLIKLLQVNGVGTILTTYWNSHVITVLSSGSVDAYPVGIGSQLKPFAHHMPRRVFYGSAGTKEAVVLSSAYSGSSSWHAVEYQLGTPYEKLSLGPFTVWIYDKDIVESVLQIGNEIDSAVQPSQVQISLSGASLSACNNDDGCHYQINIANVGRHVLSSVGFRPMRIGVHGVDEKGNVVVQDAGRADFPMALKPGQSTRIDLALPKSRDPAVSGYRLCLLQEGVSWLCDRTQSQFGHIR